MFEFGSEKLSNKGTLRNGYFSYCLVVLNIFFLLNASNANSIDKKYLKISKIANQSTFLKAKKRRSKNRLVAAITIISVTLFCASIVLIWWALSKRKANTNRPSWKFPKPGINLEYRCSNPNCASHQQSNESLNNRDYICKPYYNAFDLVEDFFCEKPRCVVPGCIAEIKRKNVTAIVMHQCSYVFDAVKALDSQDELAKKYENGKNYSFTKVNIPPDRTTPEKETKTYFKNNVDDWVKLNIKATIYSNSNELI